MNIQGRGQIGFRGKTYNASLELDLREGVITVQFPADEKVCMQPVQRDRPFILRNVTFFMQQGEMFASTLSGFHIKSLNTRFSSLHNSPLNRALWLGDTSGCALTLSPSSSKLMFRLQNFKTPFASELVFTGANLPFLPPGTIQNRHTEVNIVGTNDLISLQGRTDLLKHITHFTRMFSVLQGGRAALRSGYFRNQMIVNLVGPPRAGALGQLFSEQSYLMEFIEKYWLYLARLSGVEKRKHQLFLLNICWNLCRPLPILKRVSSISIRPLR